MKPLVLDLETHVRLCYRCKTLALCSTARAIVHVAASALIDAGGSKRMGQA